MAALIGVRLPLQRGGEHGAGECRLQRFRPEARQQPVARQSVAGHQIHDAEAARVVEADHGAVVGLEDQMIVGLGRLRRRSADQHAAGHAEMAEHHHAVVEMEQHVFGAARDPFAPGGPAAARRSPAAAGSADRGAAGSRGGSAGPPGGPRGRGKRSRLQAVRALSGVFRQWPGGVATPGPGGYCCPRR